MTRRDDRPKPSRWKKKTAEGTPACSECAFLFTDEAVARGSRYRILKDGTAVCQDDRGCRLRRLTATLGHELGTRPDEEWLFVRYPRDLVYRQMDVRPKKWKELGWRPRRTLAERAMSCILYCSWCYPVSMPFAVQLAGLLPHPARKKLDDDEILVDRLYQPEPLREKDIAVILNEHQPNVSRSLKRLVDTKELRIDEDHVFYPAAKLADMSIAERQAIYLPDHLAGDPDDELRGVPKRFRKLLVLIETHCAEDISSEIFAEVVDSCTAFNDSLRNIRTARDATIEQACSRGTNLIPDFEKLSRAKPSPSAQASNNARAVVDGGAVALPPSSPQSAVHTPPPSIDRSFSGVVDQGKGALAKLDRPRPQPTDRPSGADNPYATKIREWLESTFTEIPTSLEDREFDQIAATVHSDQHLEQFQKAARRQKEPRGWKVFVKIAQECDKHQPKYKQAGAGGEAERESPMVKQLREQQELKKSWQNKS